MPGAKVRSPSSRASSASSALRSFGSGSGSQGRREVVGGPSRVDRRLTVEWFDARTTWRTVRRDRARGVRRARDGGHLLWKPAVDSGWEAAVRPILGPHLCGRTRWRFPVDGVGVDLERIRWVRELRRGCGVRREPDGTDETSGAYAVGDGERAAPSGARAAGGWASGRAAGSAALAPQVSQAVSARSLEGPACAVLLPVQVLGSLARPRVDFHHPPEARGCQGSRKTISAGRSERITRR